MSFNNFARKVRDPSLPYPHRVSALRSCVQLYRPIGFHATLSFLTAQAGPFPRDETALLRALDLIETSRAAWQAELREYATQRRQAKQRGQRSPRPTDPNPNHLEQWHGAPRQAALHAGNFWNRNRLPALLIPPDPAAEDLQRCVTACLDSQGHLTPEQQRLLTHCTDHLEQRLRRHSWRDRPADFHRFWDLLKLARHIKTATTTLQKEPAGVRSSAGSVLMALWVWVLEELDRVSGELRQRYTLEGLSDSAARSLVGLNDLGDADLYDLPEESLIELSRRFGLVTDPLEFEYLLGREQV